MEGGEQLVGYFGKLGLPAAMTLILSAVYHFIPEGAVSDRIKTLIVLGFGILLTVVWLVYTGVQLTFVTGADCFFYGIMLGATSIGLYKVGQAAGMFSSPK